MKKAFSLLLLLYLLFTFSFVFISKSSSDELTDITKQIDDLNNALNQSVKATQPLESQLNAMRTQIKQIKDRIGTIEQDIQIKKKNIDDGYKNLAKQQAILDITIREYYIKSYYNSPILIFLSSSSASDITQLLAYHRATTNRDKAIIMNIALLVGDLENRKKTLENEEVRLTTAKAGLDEQSAKLDKIISGAKDYQSKLSGQIAQLSAQQQQIISAKQASLSSSAGRSIATQTEAGGGGSATPQGYPSTIRVKMGDGSIKSVSFEDDYLMSLGEMPDSWQSLEAFKAQAVAARTYAIFKIVRATGRDFDVYSDTRDQVYTGSQKGGLWAEAVRTTKGQFLQDGGGNAIIAYYSANAGGYTLTPNESWNAGGGFPSSVRDIGDDGKGNGDLNSRCLSDSHFRWEYHYNIGRDGKIQYNDKCNPADNNNSNDPLNEGEVQDLVDAAIWAIKNNSVPDNGKSHDQIKNEIGGDAIGSIQTISANISGDKYTSSIHIVGSNRTVDLDGQTFRLVFNVRSPGQFLIPSTTYGAKFIKYDVFRASEVNGTKGDGWYFYVYGYGHRIGLDQSGAYGLASQGKTYDYILSHYYSGTNLTSTGYSGEVK